MFNFCTFCRMISSRLSILAVLSPTHFPEEWVLKLSLPWIYSVILEWSHKGFNFIFVAPVSLPLSYIFYLCSLYKNLLKWLKQQIWLGYLYLHGRELSLSNETEFLTQKLYLKPCTCSALLIMRAIYSLKQRCVIFQFLNFK